MAAGSRQLVVFRLGREEFALPIATVQEVIRYADPRSIGAVQPWLAGVIALRGTIVPVCDLAVRLGRDAERAADAKIVVVDAGTGPAGLVVDDVVGVVTLADGRLEPLPAAGDPALTGVFEQDGRLILVLDAALLLTGIAPPERT